MRRRSKRYRKDIKKQPQEPQSLDEAIKTLQGYTRPKFDPSVDLVMHLGIDPKQADQMLRGSVTLPKGIGKAKRVIAFCQDNDAAACSEAGAVEAGGDDLVKKVQDGWFEFDVAIAHPSMMGKVGRLGRVLGPQGKMPSPKSGTVTQDVVTAVKEYSAGKLEFRNDSGGNIHAMVGKLSFAQVDLRENIVAFVDHIRKLKPATAKGTYIKNLCISGSMTPSVRVAVNAAGGVE